MAHPKMVSHGTLDGCASVCRTFREKSTSSGVVANPDLEASCSSSQPTIGQAPAQQTADESGHTSQSTPPSSSSSSTPPGLTTQGIRQWYPSAYGAPQHWHSYYDPARYHQSSWAPSFSSMSGPHLPPFVSPLGTTPFTDSTLGPLMESLKMLQSQFTAFQESLGDVKSDVTDVLSELHTLRTAQNKTDERLAELGGVIGVSSTGTASRGHGRCDGERGRGRRVDTHTESPLDNADVEKVPDETLMQSLASIQSAVEMLLTRESHASQSPIHQEATSLVDPRRQESSRTSSPPQSFLDSSKQCPISQSTQFASRTFFASKSQLSFPLSSITNPTSDLGTSLPPAAPVKEYANVSIQACPPFPTFGSSCSLSHSQKHAPRFTPENWNLDSTTLGRSADNFGRPTPYATEYLAYFPRDTFLPSATNAVAASEDPQGDSHHTLRGSTTSHTQLPTRTMSALTLSYPTEIGADNSAWVGGTSPKTESASSPTRVLQSSRPQIPTLTTGDVDSSMTAPLIGQTDNLHFPITSLCSLNSTDSMLMLASGTSRHEHHSVPLPPHRDPEDSRMISDTDNVRVSVTGVAKTVSEPTPAAMEHRRQGSPWEADEGGLTSGLPTPPSETFAGDHDLPLGHSTYQDSAIADPALVSCTYPPQNFSVIPTPPSLTPELSPGENRALDAQGSHGVLNRTLTPLTSPSFLPTAVKGSSLSEEDDSNMSRQAAAQKVTEERADLTDGVRGGVGTEGVDAGAPMSSGRSSPGSRTDPNYATDLGTSVVSVTRTRRSIVTSNEDSSKVSQGSFAGQPSMKLAERHVETNDTSPEDFQMDGFGFDFSSLQHRPGPPISATLSLCATPSDSSSARPSPEETEVLNALMFGDSGISTPVPDFGPRPFMFSQHPSHTSSHLPHPSQQLTTTASTYADNVGVNHASSTLAPELFIVDPSMPCDPTSTLPPHGHESLGLPPSLNESLSPLTSLGESVVGNPTRLNHGTTDNDTARRCKKPRTSSPVAPTNGPRESSSRGHRSEPRAVAPTVAASEAMGNGRTVGGPSASLDELSLLARRQPLKIHLRLPETMRGVKRQRGADGEEGREGEEAEEKEKEGAGREDGCTDSHRKPTRPRACLPMDDASQEGRGRRVSAGISSGMSSCQIGVAASALSISNPLFVPEGFISGGLVDDTGEHSDLTSHFPVSGKRTRRQTERGRQEAVRVRERKRKRVLNAKPKPLVKYHIRNGRIVALQPATELEATPPPKPRLREQASELLSASMRSVCVEEAGQGSRTASRIHHRTGREKEALEAPFSSSAKSCRPSPRSGRCVGPSPMKEELWNTISQVGGRWPKLPSVFSLWDTQFIQCDNCDMWFHYGCVGIGPADPRLEPAALFICPTCHTQSAARKTLRNRDDACARPDCAEPQVAGETELFFVEKLVGRKKTEGHIYTWLAKWEGYPLTQASWIPKENIVGDGTKLLNGFIEDAVSEGMDLSSDVVLLREAVEAGWEAC